MTMMAREMEIREEGREEGRAEGREEEKKSLIYELVREGLLSKEDGARKLGVSALKLAEGISSYGM